MDVGGKKRPSPPSKVCSLKDHLGEWLDKIPRGLHRDEALWLLASVAGTPHVALKKPGRVKRAPRSRFN